MPDIISQFLREYTSYIVIATSVLTCVEFFKSRSRVFVYILVVVGLLIAIFAHNQVINFLDGLVELISIYRHTRSSQGKTQWLKLGLVLGVPLVIWGLNNRAPVWFQTLQNASTNTVLVVELAFSAVIYVVICIILGLIGRYCDGSKPLVIILTSIAGILGFFFGINCVFGIFNIFNITGIVPSILGMILGYLILGGLVLALLIGDQINKT